MYGWPESDQDYALPMTLSVTLYVRNSENELNWLPLPADFNDLAGVESSRLTFWGASKVKQLGLTLLPELAHGDIYAEGIHLQQLERELEILSAHLSELCKPDLQNYWRFRLANIIVAISIAKEHSGGVYFG